VAGFDKGVILYPLSTFSLSWIVLGAIQLSDSPTFGVAGSIGIENHFHADAPNPGGVLKLG
jgi:hypothetical protein